LILAAGQIASFSLPDLLGLVPVMIP